jgi:hypothetical protein
MLTIAPGAELPSGTYRLGAERHTRMVEALGGHAPADGSAHPLATWLIAMGGIGFGIGDLFAAAGVPLEDGPMLGACELELSRPLDPETTYDVSGRIAAVEEKSGRRLGRFDVLTLELDVISEGERAARCTCSMILPR